MVYCRPLNVLLVSCHPEPRSLTRAVARHLADEIRRCEAGLFFHDLYAEAFDPVLSAAELRRGFPLAPDVQLSIGELEKADLLAVVHPDWWGGPPAMLKGWVERTFRQGVAYDLEGVEFSRKSTAPLLSGKSAVVFVTTDAPASERAPLLEAVWGRGICEPTGLGLRGVHVLGEVHDRSAANRAAWIAEAGERLRSLIVSPDGG